LCGEQVDLHAMAARDAGDTCAGRVGVGRDADGVDEAEFDDVEREGRIVAVAQCGEDVGFSELERLSHGFDDSMIRGERVTIGR
jgi:hypothetical protein